MSDALLVIGGAVLGFAAFAPYVNKHRHEAIQGWRDLLGTDRDREEGNVDTRQTEDVDQPASSSSRRWWAPFAFAVPVAAVTLGAGVASGEVLLIVAGSVGLVSALGAMAVARLAYIRGWY